MKRIILSILLGVSAVSTYAQEMSEEQLQSLKEMATQLHPTNNAQRNAWFQSQKSAFENIAYANYALSPADMATIKKSAEEKYPNNYIEQEQFIKSQATNMLALNHLAKGLDPQEFIAIKNVVMEEARGDTDQYTLLIREHLDCKDSLNNLVLPEGIDIVSFKIAQRIIEEYYPYNYKKQYEEILKKLEESRALIASLNPAMASEAAANDSNAYSTIGTLILEKSTLVTNDENAYQATAVEFKDKIGFFCSLNAYSKNLSLVNNLGEAATLEKIHLSKDLPIMFIEVKSFPAGISPVKILPFETTKVMLGNPLSIAGRLSSTKSTCSKASIAAIRNDSYILNGKTPASFKDGAILLDFSTSTLVSIMLKYDNSPKSAPNFEDKNKALTEIRRFGSETTANSKLDGFYPIIDKLEDFELLDDQKMAQQMDYLNKFKKDNLEVLEFLSLNTMASLAKSNKYSKIAKDSAKTFDNKKLGEKNYLREGAKFISKIIAVAKKDFNPNLDTSIFYINVKKEIEYQIALRQNFISYLEKTAKNDLEEILPNDISSAKQEPQKKSKSSTFSF